MTQPINDIKNKFATAHPDSEINSIASYKDGYLITAGQKDALIDSDARSYYMHDNTIDGFNPMSDLDGYTKAFNDNMLYSKI